jgi:hypothetical protein
VFIVQQNNLVFGSCTSIKLFLQMISLFIKQTSSVESHRVAQLVGNVNDAAFQQRAKQLHEFFFPCPDESNTATVPSESQQNEICTKRFEVTVLSASNLPKKDLLGSVDPFCQIVYAGFVHQTEVKMRDRNPCWKNESFWFDVLNNQLPKSDKLTLDTSIEIIVLDWDRLKSNDIIGRVSISNNVLKEILNAPEDSNNEFELELSNDGNLVCDAAGSPSIIKIRVKNIGRVISGCEISSLKDFFLLYDNNHDGRIDEDEFSAMLKKILSVTTLFTGTEGGDSILKKLSPTQVRALLDHKWIAPDQEMEISLETKLQTIMGNIKEEDNTSKPAQKSQGKEVSLNQNSSESGPESAEVSIVEQSEGEENIMVNPSSESSMDKESVEVIEELGEKLKKLAWKLRQFGVIKLPTLLWGDCNQDIPDSAESIAMRYIYLISLLLSM